jgi:hypothetical protein
MQHVSSYVRSQLCEAIFILLENEDFPTRLSKFTQYLISCEIPHDICIEMHEIANIYVECVDDQETNIPRARHLSAEQEAMLTERLLAIYIDIQGGSLIF